MKIQKYNRPKDDTRGGSSSIIKNIVSETTSSDVEHASNADYATVAGNLDSNSSDWDTIDSKDEAVKTWTGLQYLSKLVADAAQGFITFVSGLRANIVSYFDKGVEFGDYTAGVLGAGGAVLIDDDGNSTAEFDYLTVRKAASFREITIKELKHVGGEIVLSSAAMKCSSVEMLNADNEVITSGTPSYYKCYFDTTDADGNVVVYQEFVAGDLARCQAFSTSVNETSGYATTKYYWRLVSYVGEDYIILSNLEGEMDAGSTSAPAENDNIVQLGYVGGDNPYRTSAIILSATESDSPSMKSYQGITTFTLPDPVKDEGYDPTTGVFHCNIYGDFFAGDSNSYIQYDSTNDELNIKGTVNMSSSSQLDGQSITGIIGDITDSVDNLNTGNDNLVVNGGFTGSYSSEGVESTTTISGDMTIYSDPFGHWDTHTNCTIVSSTISATGLACQLASGTLTQTITRQMENGNPYTFSFLGVAAGTVTVSISGNTEEVTVVPGTRACVKFTALTSSGVLNITGTATISDVQIVQGNITISDWSPSSEDNNKYLSYYKNLAYLMESISDGSTTTLGGLILTQLIRVGNYANQSMVQETGGMSGSYANDNSPFLWGGGTMQQAISTIATYANDPTYQPTDDELAAMANFVVTHGGRAILNDIIMRGIVYATGGNFTGKEGMFRIAFDADERKISVYGPSAVTSLTGWEPTDDATEVEYLSIGEFFHAGGNDSTWTISPRIKMNFPTAVGGIYLTIDANNGLVIRSVANGQTTTSVYTQGGISLDNSNIFFYNLPTDGTYCSSGQLYNDNGTLKIKT